jgi:hypothetical protein
VRQVLPGWHDVTIPKYRLEQLLQQGAGGDAERDVSSLLSLGLLARDARADDSFQFTLPGLGKLVKQVAAGGSPALGAAPAGRPGAHGTVQCRLMSDPGSTRAPLLPPDPSRTGRRELLALLAKRKYGEIMERELVGKRKLLQSGLGMQFHLRDLLGLGLAAKAGTPAGPVIRMVKHARG